MRFLIFTLLWIVVCTARAETFEGRVVGVYDGDTLTVLFNGARIDVRLMEIDAPELQQPFGWQARQSLNSLCSGTRARVAWTKKDGYGLTHGRVWCRGVDANAEQVRRGMAWVLDGYAKDVTLPPMQKAARAARLGLWADGNPMPPWDYRFHSLIQKSMEASKALEEPYRAPDLDQPPRLLLIPIPPVPIR